MDAHQDLHARCTSKLLTATLPENQWYRTLLPNQDIPRLILSKAVLWQFHTVGLKKKKERKKLDTVYFQHSNQDSEQGYFTRMDSRIHPASFTRWTPLRDHYIQRWDNKTLRTNIIKVNVYNWWSGTRKARCLPDSIRWETFERWAILCELMLPKAPKSAGFLLSK